MVRVVALPSAYTAVLAVMADDAADAYRPVPSMTPTG